jgi:hypothetical protein
MTVQRDLFAERQHRISRATALRAVLSDGQWHLGTELAVRIGHRFGGALLVVARGEDGCAPWLIQRERLKSSGAVWRYRFLRPLAPDEVAKGETWKGRAQRLEKSVRQLEAEKERLEQLVKRLEQGTQEVLSLGGAA